MNSNRFILFMLSFSMFIFSNRADAQNSDSTQREIFTFVEQMPEFYGDMMMFISKNIRYPKEALEKGAEGRVVVNFIINEDGSIDKDNIQVVKSVGFGMDEESIRVVKLMPNWKPGKQNGRPVAVRYTLPISFKLKN